MIYKKLKYRCVSLLDLVRRELVMQKERLRYIESIKLVKNDLIRLDSIQISNSHNEIRLFCIMRNEALRLPHFLAYYERLGVDRFFFVDNGSNDGSVEIVLGKNDCHVFSIDNSYKNHWTWMEYLLESYGKGHWCVVADVDELFSWPDYEQVTLPDLIAYLEIMGETAVRSLLLDLYPKEPVRYALYNPGDDPLKTLCWFDMKFDKTNFRFFDRKGNVYFEMETYIGGVRDRVFRQKMPNHLSKISLFKMAKRTYLTQGMHAINHARVSSLHGVTFHTKFLHDLPAEAREESKREVHFGNAIVYKIVDSVLRCTPDISFWNENSCELIDSEQLVQIGLMKRPAGFREFIDTHLRGVKQNLDIVS